ncbi:MAG: hypothetical protein ACLVAU_11125 [Ruminococcus sp.]
MKPIIFAFRYRSQQKPITKAYDFGAVGESGENCIRVLFGRV